MASRTRKRQVQIVVDVKSAKAIRAIKKLAKENREGFGSIRKSIRDTFGPFKKFKDNIQALDASLRVMTTGLNAARTAIRGVLSVLEASAAQRSGVNQMRHAFQQLGSVDVPEAVSALEDFADEQQRVTRFGDDATRAVATNIATMLQGTQTSAQELIALTGLVQDIVERTGKGAEEVGRQVSQIYVGHTEAIGELLPSQREAVRMLRETEGAGAAAALALDELNETFGGAAEQIDATEQSLARARNTWGDFIEVLGDQMSDALEESGLMGDIQTGLEDLIEWVSQNGDTIRQWVRDVAEGFMDVGRAIVWAFSQLTAFWQARRDFRAEEAEHAQEGDPVSERIEAAFAERDRLIEQLGLRAPLGLDPAAVTEDATEGLADLILAEEAVAAAFADPGTYRVTEETMDALWEQGFITLQDWNTRAQHAAREALEQYGFSIRSVSNMAEGEIEAAIEQLRGLRLTSEQLQEETVRRARDREALDAPATGDEPVLGALGLTPDVGGGGGGGGGGDEPVEALASSMAFPFAASLELAISEALRSVSKNNLVLAGAKTTGEKIGSTMGESIVTGMDIATQALQGFAQTIPRIMEGGAKDGADRIAAVFQFMGQAAQIAAAVGVAAKASTSWLGPLSQFFAMAAAAASFAGAMGAGGGGGGSTGAGARGATGAEAADVLVGQRPEATRGGITRNISINAGAIFNAGADTRRALMHEIRVAEGLNEISFASGGM